MNEYKELKKLLKVN